jgi:hypothetical protein
VDKQKERFGSNYTVENNSMIQSQRKKERKKERWTIAI